MRPVSQFSLVLRGYPEVIIGLAQRITAPVRGCTGNSSPCILCGGTGYYLKRSVRELGTQATVREEETKRCLLVKRYCWKLNRGERTVDLGESSLSWFSP